MFLKNSFSGLDMKFLFVTMIVFDPIFEGSQCWGMYILKRLQNTHFSKGGTAMKFKDLRKCSFWREKGKSENGSRFLLFSLKTAKKLKEEEKHFSSRRNDHFSEK